MRFVTFAALLALSAPALAQQTDTAPAPASPVKEKKICRALDVTGSIMSKRTCHTREEWRQIDDSNGDNAQRTLGNRRAGATGLDPS
ncbi:Spy/CpxP family protein refolding chaperone [Sphingomonas kyeonggiensis]|uniref:hypothetical protein n=1 Tax=Sphingomonas kyeonggiensis TaxID=1268553 RepID=UPI00277D3431|nr:hypothetical protein [Sphingomonas kyeonggiensis]MDQ0249314.1 Spy/CpxP family protein refolding chaperone [Sphingomonas kyeonggiensis]